MEDMLSHISLNSMHEWKGLGCTRVCAFLEVGVGGELF